MVSAITFFYVKTYYNILFLMPCYPVTSLIMSQILLKNVIVNLKEEVL